MADSPTPTLLNPRRRAGLLAARRIMDFFALVEKRRRAPASASTISLHRYGSSEAETLQYIPREPGSPQRTPVVFIHGGGWIIGKKEFYTREHPGVHAVHFMGDSAGANLAMMLGLFSANPGLLNALDADPTSPFPIACHSVVSLYGVLDRLSWVQRGFPGAALMLECYGGRPALAEAVGAELSFTPMDLEFENHPPCFLIAGSKDRLCDSTRLCAKRLEAGTGIVSTKFYAGESHGFFNMAWRPACAELKRGVLTFFERHDPSVAVTAATPQGTA